MDKIQNPEHYHFIATLEKHVQEILKTRDRALISVVGKNGTGKSHFGRVVRKKGLGRFSNRAITVIDDRVMILEFLYFFKKRVKIPRNGVKDLETFLNNLPERIKIILYINNTPSEKINEADILLKLTTDERTRERRLHERYGNEPEKLKRYLNKNEVEGYGIKYSYLLEAEV